jgi:hypothetical protein
MSFKYFASTFFGLITCLLISILETKALTLEIDCHAKMRHKNEEENITR